MYPASATLHEAFSKLSIDKMGKALSYIRYLASEAEEELYMSEEEEAHFHALRESDDFISASDMRAKIKGLPND